MGTRGVGGHAADVRVLHDPEVVIKAARAAVQRLPANVKRVHTFALTVPREVVADTRWVEYYDTGGYLSLVVPVDDQLEQRALADVRSDNPIRRAEGTRTLANFKTDENLAIVRSLLGDADFSFHTTDGLSVERYYPVRHAAWQTLRACGVHVEQPVCREEVNENLD